VSLGGDTDTLGAMAASIAATIYDIPAELKEQCYTLLPKDLQDINDEFVQLIKQCDSSISPNKAIGSPLNYYKVENSIYAGEYPYAVNPMLGIKKLDVLNDLKVNTIIDLTENGELYQYTASIRANCTHYRFPIKDRNIPDSFDNVYNLMAYIDNAKSENGTIYIHCWGGVGRTGTIVACWLVYNGMSANEALAHLNELWKSCPKSRRRPYCPDHGCQIGFIKHYEIYIKNSNKDGQKDM
jgi:protein-tyrosine phosphatase